MELSPEVQAKLDQFSKLSKGTRAGILGVIAVLMCLAYYFMLYQGASEKLAGLQAKELELQRKLSEVRSIAANITAFENEIGELEIKLSTALRQLPNKQQLEVLLTDISNLGKTAGIEVKSFRRQEERIHDFYAEVPIAIELAGSYHDIAHFFDLMSKLPRIVNMGSIKMSVTADSATETRLKVSGIATAFRFVGNG